MLDWKDDEFSYVKAADLAECASAGNDALTGGGR